jgi:branched-chain amino acid transport system ATP-binding protein
MKAFRGDPILFASTAPEKPRTHLEVKDLTLRLGGITALSKIDLSVQSGELVSLIGPNGAGKTSLLDCLCGVHRPQSGKITLNGEDITHLPPHRVAASGIGRTYKTFELFGEMTVLANMMLARHVHLKYNVAKAFLFAKDVKAEEAHQRQLVEQLIDFLDIQAVRTERVANLPMGMRKRVDLGRALALNPEILILDEPFTGMTHEEKEDMVRFLQELNEIWHQTILLVEHDMSIVMSISKRVIVFDFGVKIAEGSPDFVQKHPQVIKAYLG